ncbi:hypothetical protein FHX59_005934 [Paraburkholderia silvatlantica]|uniref:Uncharacterized protein n=1 Tax=Paraburkholderia silvatlantica TaxID=321895 RepID=A0ABR6FVR7_9BURK|nr:hypothetical protein [Paraburkholderia silvatlantica]PVY27873.1 hypothetical protein C7411_11866 [Paraburkholderia silvatlantica]PXW34720.1 hypothetical protein C7413_11766 [Paraburkholderia silvatlantica]
MFGVFSRLAQFLFMANRVLVVPTAPQNGPWLQWGYTQNAVEIGDGHGEL